MAAEDHWHFTGKFLGVFKGSHAGTTHAAVFHDVKWVALEIRDVKRISSRDTSREKVGDFHYERVMKPKSRWSLGGVDLSILKDDRTAFSERIYDVVLVRYSQDRDDFSPVRKFAHARTSELEYVVEGVVYFSLPAEPVKRPPVAVSDQTFRPSSTIIGIDATPITSNQEPVVVTTDPVSAGNLASRPGCFSIGRSNSRSATLQPASGRSGCLNAGGCMGSLFRLFRWFFFAYIFLRLIGLLAGWLSNQVRDQRSDTRNGNVTKGKQRLDPKQDTMAAQPWNYLVDHEVKWFDFVGHYFNSRYTTSTYEFEASAKRHQAWQTANSGDELLFYHDLYEDMYRGDRQKLDSLVRYFDTERRLKRLDPLATAEMVVTFIQEIPYVLVHDGSCQEASLHGGFMADYHADGKPCLPNVVAGVLSPYEFAHTLDGDCDTRSLLAYTLLDRLGIGSSVWISREYGHSIAGVAVPVNSSHYKRIDGTRYFGVELTVKGFRIGMISPAQTDMDNWDVVLHNR